MFCSHRNEGQILLIFTHYLEHWMEINEMEYRQKLNEYLKSDSFVCNGAEEQLVGFGGLNSWWKTAMMKVNYNSNKSHHLYFEWVENENERLCLMHLHTCRHFSNVWGVSSTALLSLNCVCIGACVCCSTCIPWRGWNKWSMFEICGVHVRAQ